MVQRTVSVGLVANVNNYVAGMEKARLATEKTAAAAVGSEKQLRAQAEAMSKVGLAAMGAGAVAAAGLALVVKATADYNAKMAQLQSLSHASAGTMKELSSAAMEQGKAYGYSATQVADAEIELTKAGLSASQILGGGLKSALSLAAAGQLDVGQATEISTIAMTDFGLKAAELPHVSDLLAAGADKALGSVGDLGEALSNGGQQAHNMGLTIDQTVGVMSAFANAGIIGAEAGTQLRSMFIQLQHVTPQAQAVLDHYKISIYDTSGHFVGMSKLAGELSDRLGNLSDAQRNAALATIFGSHAITGASVLMNLGAKGVQDWTNKVNEYGFANAQAAGKLNSLTGDAQKLSAAFQTDLIKAGSGANGMLRNVTQGASGLLDVVGSIPEPLLNMGVALTAGVAAVGLIGGAAIIAVPKIALFRKTISEAGISTRGFAGTVGKGTAIVAGLASIAGGLSLAGQRGEASSEQIAKSADSMRKSLAGVNSLFTGSGVFQTGGLKTALDDSFGNGGWNQSSLAHYLKGATGGIIDFSGIYEKNEGQFRAFGEQLGGLAQENYGSATQGFRELVKAAGGGKNAITALAGDAMPAYRAQIIKLLQANHLSVNEQNIQNAAMGRGRVGAQLLAAAAATAAAAANTQGRAERGLATDIQKVYVAQTKLSKANQDFESSENAALDAVAAVGAALKQNGGTLDQNTAKGRANREATLSAVQAIQAHAAAIDKDGKHASEAAVYTDKQAIALERTLEQYGVNSKAAQAYVNKLLGIPKNVSTTAQLKADQAEAKLAAIRRAMNNLDGSTAEIYVNAVANGVSTGRAAQVAKNARLGMADGGAVGGPGPKGVDSVPAVLAPGEHVLTASDVDKMGGQSGVYAFRNALHMAAGGAVGDAQNAESRAKSQATTASRQLTQAKNYLKQYTHDASRADAAYQKAATAAQNIYGKGTAAKKHAAEVHARDLKKKADQAKTYEEKQQKLVDSIQKRLDTAKQTEQTAADRYTSLTQASEDFVSAQRRDPNPDPLSYVDQLRTMSRDTADFGPKRRASFDKAANQYEKSLVNLAAKSEAAAQKLSDLKGASDQMKSSIQSAIAGGYQASNTPLTGAHDASTRNVASGWITRNGIRMQNYTTVDVAASAGKVTAAGLASYYKGGAADTKTFANQLKALAARKVNPALLAEIAGYGVAQGSPIAAALLSATAGQIASINAGYTAIQGNAAAAGTTVANDNYAALIKSAQANADNITKQIATDSEKLRKLIASAFGLKGYAVGTSSASPGLHLVGERGPELLRFKGGEQVYTAGQTRAYIRGSRAAGGGQQIVVQAPQVVMPDTITVQDASGFTTTMRVVAHEVVTARHEQIAVHLMGAAS